MSFVRKHWDITGEQVRRIEADPDSVSSPEDEAILAYLTLPDEKRGYALGKFTLGRFEEKCDGYHTDCLHTGSITGSDFKEIGRGVVMEDLDDPDGIYETYVPV